MRLLIIAPEAYPVPSARGSSVETCIYNLATHLSRYHEVTVVSRSMPNLPPVSVQDGLRIIRVPSGSRGAYINRVLRAIEGRSYDHIQVDNRPGFLAAVRQRFPGTPLSIFLHSLSYITPPISSTRQAQSQLAHANMVVVNSASLASRVKELHPAHAHRVHVVHLGVDTSKFRAPTPSQRLLARRIMGLDHAFVIGFVGRFVPIKGIPILLKAAELVADKIPHTTLLLAGSGTRRYVAQIKALARESRVPVRFLGRVPRAKIPRVYWAFDCFVCPTQGHEAFGLVVVEALATGIPTVASANGGIREIITHGADGLLVQQFTNPRCFAEAILAMARDPGGAQLLGMRGRKTCIDRFSWSGSSEALHRLYFGGGCRD